MGADRVQCTSASPYQGLDLAQGVSVPLTYSDGTNGYKVLPVLTPSGHERTLIYAMQWRKEGGNAEIADSQYRRRSFLTKKDLGVLQTLVACDGVYLCVPKRRKKSR